MGFKLPESLEGLTAAELKALINEARAALKALNITGESSDEDIANAEYLVDAIATLKDGETAAIAAEQAKQERLDRIAAASTEPEDDDDAPAEDASVEEAQTPELVVAAAAPAKTPNPVKAAAANALPIDFVPAKPSIVLTAAANVPGVPDGKHLESMKDIVDVISARIKAMPKHNLATKTAGFHQRFGAVQIHRDPVDPELVQGNTGNDWDLVERAGNEKRLPGGSLVAAALDPAVTGPAWCSPSETLYELCEVQDVTGMWDVPEFTVSRGGIRYTKGPKWEDIYGDANRGFFIDNEPAAGKLDNLILKDADGGGIAGTGTPANPKKPCIMVDCYPWEEVRMSCDGVCIKSPILLEVTYPELIQRFTEMVLVAHRHDVNRRHLAQLRAAAVANGGAVVHEAFGDGSTAPAFAANNGRTIFNLQSIEFTAMGLRSKYRMAQNATLEVVAPWWLAEVIRMDLAMENGRNNRTVSDAEINSWFTSRNMRVQWVYDWQDIHVQSDHKVSFPLNGAGDPTAYGAAGAAPQWVELIMYPAGTWTKGTADVINLDTVYDSAGLADNVFTALFMEECDLLVQRCTETIALQVPLCISGQGVLDALADCVTQTA